MALLPRGAEEGDWLVSEHTIAWLKEDVARLQAELDKTRGLAFARALEIEKLEEKFANSERRRANAEVLLQEALIREAGKWVSRSR